MPIVGLARARRVPSKPNGFVTMPTVSAPISRAIRATIGAAPVPVPPPAPAVMKIMSQPLSSALILSYSSIAAGAAEVRVRARAEAARDAGADVQRDVGGRLLQRLQVGVDRDELDALDLGLDHAVDGVDAGAADADDAQDRRAGVRGVAASSRANGSCVRGGAESGAAGRGALHQVLRDVGARRRGAGAPAASGCVGSSAAASAGLADAARGCGTAGALARDAAPPVGLGAAPGAAGCLGLRLLLVGPAEQGRQRAFAHARALLAGCHRGPPSRDRDRTAPPCRPGRT